MGGGVFKKKRNNDKVIYIWVMHQHDIHTQNEAKNVFQIWSMYPSAQTEQFLHW